MANKWNILANIGLALTAILSIATGIVEQKQMEAQITETVNDILAKRTEKDET